MNLRGHFQNFYVILGYKKIIQREPFNYWWLMSVIVLIVIENGMLKMLVVPDWNPAHHMIIHVYHN